MILEKAGATVAAEAAILTEGDRAKWMHIICTGAFAVVYRLTKIRGGVSPPLHNQFLFLFTREALDSPLSFHGSRAVRLGFEINHLYRKPAASVARTGAFVVLFQASLRVGRPAGVISPIRAFQNITIKRHTISQYQDVCAIP